MRSIVPTLSCAGFLGVVFGIIAFVVSLAVTWDIETAAVGASMWAVLAFLAAALLALRDNLKRTKVLREIRRIFAGRPKISADQFCDYFAPWDRDIALAARKAVAAFYEIPEDRLHPDVDLWSDPVFAKFEASVRFVVVRGAFPEAYETEPFEFPTSRPETLGDLVRELGVLREALEKRPGNTRDAALD